MASELIIGNNDVSYVFDGNSKYSNTAIQNFAYSTINRLWIYATQRVGGNTILSKYCIDESTKKANLVSQIILEGYGHGETLEATNLGRNDIEYVWVGSNCKETENGWSTRIARLLLDANGVTIHEVKYLKNFRNASMNGKILGGSGTVNRLMACLSYNKSAMCFKINTVAEGTKGKVYKRFFSVYNFNKINKMMNERADAISMDELTGAVKSVVIGKYIDGYQCMTMGMDNELFISSGNLNAGKDLYIKRYLLSAGESNMPNPTGSKNIEYSQEFAIHGNPQNAEMEGIKYNNGYIQFFSIIKEKDKLDAANRVAIITRPAADILK